MSFAKITEHYGGELYFRDDLQYAKWNGTSL